MAAIRQSNLTSNCLESRVEAGEWLASARRSAGLSQRELAGKLGDLYHTFISQIEAGKGRLPSERYQDYAEALKIDTRHFAITMLRFYEPTTYQLIFRD